MHKNMQTKLVVVGATGNVGRRIVEMILHKQIYAAKDLELLASEKSAGKNLKIGDHSFSIQNTKAFDFNATNLYIFATDEDISKQYIPKAISSQSYIIDSSSFYRLDADIPLIVGPVNNHLVSIDKSHIYAIANCVASPIAIVLAPLHAAFAIKRVHVVTYQSTSGAGRAPMDELYLETKHSIEGKSYPRKHFKRQIAFNVIPQIGSILEDGFTHEEFKIMKEVQKILDANFPITATAVRVPVIIGHSVLLSIEFEKQFEMQNVFEILAHAQAVKLSHNDYMTPVEVEGSDDVYVGRIRRDPSVPFGLHLWLCSDNLRRGAATDAVEVAAELIKQLQVK